MTSPEQAAPITLHTIAVEGCIAEKAMFKVETFDECAAVVTLHNTVHNAHSWRELSAAVEKALLMLELEGDGE